MPVKKVMLKCLECGKVFERKYNAQKHCTPDCRKKYSAKSCKAKYDVKLFECHWCGIFFEADHKRKYCTEECRFASYGRGRRRLNKNNLEQINKLAREAGLSYGQYVAKMGLR